MIKAQNFDDALAIANNTEYGLTGAVYTASPERIERAKRDFHVGNLYINRVHWRGGGLHPFRRFNIVRDGFEGGRCRLLVLFAQAKSIGEKL